MKFLFLFNYFQNSKDRLHISACHVTYPCIFIKFHKKIFKKMMLQCIFRTGNVELWPNVNDNDGNFWTSRYWMHIQNIHGNGDYPYPIVKYYLLHIMLVTKSDIYMGSINSICDETNVTILSYRPSLDMVFWQGLIKVIKSWIPIIFITNYLRSKQKKMPQKNPKNLKSVNVLYELFLTFFNSFLVCWNLQFFFLNTMLTF